MRSQVEEKFSDFYEKWMIQLESDLHLLLVSVSKDGSNGPDHESLVARVTAHQKVYYTAKWAAAHDEVLAFFRPVWLSPLEKAYLWVTGWKPSAVFRLVESARGSSLAGMSEGQVKKVEELRVRIRLEEEKVEREMERVQVSVADRRMVELARVAGRAQVQARDGDAARVDGMVDDSVNTLLAGLEKVMKMADCARLKTLKGILESLDPVQSVHFLAATSMLHIQLRRLGMKRDREREDKESSTCP